MLNCRKEKENLLILPLLEIESRMVERNDNASVTPVARDMQVNAGSSSLEEGTTTVVVRATISFLRKMLSNT